MMQTFHANGQITSTNSDQPYTTEFTQSRDGKVTLRGTRTVSKDGRTMTITAKGTTAKGEPVDDLHVFEKR